MRRLGAAKLLMARSCATSDVFQKLVWRLPCLSPCLSCTQQQCLPGRQSECPPFGEMTERAMETTPPSFLQPWGLVWYSDEIGPGNQLKHSNKRKVQCIYWSMLPLGQHAMGCEFCWFTLCAIRSSVVAEIGGMSVLFRQLATLFFERPDFRHCLVLQCPGQTRLLFAA